MKFNDLNKFSNNFPNTEKMPILFLGHGNPMNAIEENQFVNSFRQVGNEIQKPDAILCISAHWETRGTYVTAMPNPKTIHDFGGFPQELFDVQYPAPGSPELALETKSIIQNVPVELDYKWGLDHGAWSVIKHLFPNADIPVVQLSLDYTEPPEFHFKLARELQILRRKGVLILGSGNIVHNLSKVDWKMLNNGAYAYDWAIEANEKVKSYIVNGDFKRLIDYKNQGQEFIFAIPTPEHFLPLIYILALKDKNDSITFFNDEYVGGSLSMTSVKIE